MPSRSRSRPRTATVKQTIDTTITSSLDQTILPDRPLVVGPVYTPNPDLAGHPDGKLPEGTGVACPPQRADPESCLKPAGHDFV